MITFDKIYGMKIKLMKFNLSMMKHSTSVKMLL